MAGRRFLRNRLWTSNMSSQSHSSPGSIAPHPAYDQPAALLSAQFLATVHDEFVLLDCSSGLMSDLNAPAPIAPVHSRLALTWGAVARLHAMLGSILAQKSSATMTNSQSA